MAVSPHRIRAVVLATGLALFSGHIYAQTDAASQTMQEIPTRNGVIEGTVFSEDGDPVSGAVIVALMVKHESNDVSAVETAQASSDDQGAFRIFGLPAGSYVLKVDSSEEAAEDGEASSEIFFPRAPADVGKDTIDLANGASVGGLTLTLPRGKLSPSIVTAGDLDDVSLEGQVLGTKDAPLADANVDLKGTSPRRVRMHTRTDASGRFSFPHVPAGTFRIDAKKTGFLKDAPGMHSSRSISLGNGKVPGQVVLRLMPAAVITGKVSAEDGPVTRALVNVAQISLVKGEKTLRVVKRMYTNDLGNYRIFDLQPGRYYVTVFPPPVKSVKRDDPDETAKPEGELVQTFYPATPLFEDAVPVDLQKGAVASSINVDLYKARLWSVKGRVLPLLQGHFDAPPSVSLMPLNPMMTHLAAGHDVDVSNAGSFRIEDVASGRYMLVAQAQAGGQSYTAAVPLDVPESNVNDVLVAVTQAARIHGKITPNKTGVCSHSDLRVQLRSMGMSGTPQSLEASVDEQGSFVIEDVRPDRFRVTLQGMDERCYLESVMVGTQHVNPDDLPLGQSDAPLIFRLSPHAGRVEGEVIDESRQPVLNARVIAVLQGSTSVSKEASTDEAGKFSLPGLAPGTYDLFAWNATVSSDTAESPQSAATPSSTVTVQEDSDLHMQVPLASEARE